MQDQGKQPKPESAIEQALGHPKRLEILGHLKQRGEADEAELVEALDLSPPRVRYHLLVLQSADLVVCARDPDQGGAGHSFIATAAGR